MAAPYLSLQNLYLTFGGTPLIEGAELFVHPGDRLALVGRNGSGKSTLLKVAAGMLEPDRGKRVLQAGVSLRYLSQEPQLSGYPTTLAFASEGLQHDEDLHRARHLLEDLGLRGDEDPSRLSGGEARRAALARALAPQPDILLLDEPTNHLDLPAIEWLETYLRGTRSALVLISHDRRFLSSLSRATLWLDRGRVRRLEQGFSAFEAWRDEVLAEEERDAHKLDRKIVAEEHWVRYGVTARRKRNVRRMAELEGLRKNRRERSRAPGLVRLAASEAEISGKLVMEAKGIAKTYGDRTIIKELDLLVARGDRLALVGANGSGKTTLLNLLTGRLAPDSGSVRLGASLQMVVLDQGRAALDPDLSVSDTLTQGRGDKVTVAGQTKHVMSYMKDFLFQPEQARTPVGVLSGGERGRLLLAVALAQPSNLLVLDEPTNDLDLETLDLLQEMLADYPGTVLLVSHDRDFLDRVATSVLMNEGEGGWLEYAGGYSDMVAQRGAGVRAAAAAATEKRNSEKPREAGRLARVKLTFAQQQALKTLPEKISTLEKGIGLLREKLADGAFYQRDPQGFAKAGAQLADLERTLASAEEEWLALEILREEVEAR